MSRPSSRFVYAICRPLCQKLVKCEVEARYPELRLGYSRPGLLSYKQERSVELAQFSFRPHLAHRSGLALGTHSSLDEIVGAVESNDLRDFAVHVSIRPTDEGAPDSDPTDVERVRLEVERALASRLATRGERTSRAPLWLDLVLPPPSAAADPWFLGVAAPLVVTSPFGPEAARIPEASPSRAFAKIDEAIRHFGLEFRDGQTALELGSAPGGATYALLDRGLHVIGVDPGDMDPVTTRVAEERGVSFVHVQKPALSLDAGDLHRPVDWLLSDMNLAPQVTVTHVARALSLVKKTVRGVVLTLKMNDDHAVRSIPSLSKRLDELGFPVVRTAQLPSHRREFVAVLTKR